jgi:hypothetical protein
MHTSTNWRYKLPLNGDCISIIDDIIKNRRKYFINYKLTKLLNKPRFAMFYSFDRLERTIVYNIVIKIPISTSYDYFEYANIKHDLQIIAKSYLINPKKFAQSVFISENIGGRHLWLTILKGYNCYIIVL